MHFFGISVWFAFSALLYANLAFQSSHEYYDYEQEEGDDGTELSEPDLEEQLRSAGSVDELMRLLYPSYWNILKCHSKRTINSRFSHRDPITRPDEPSFAAAYFNLDIFKSIEAEWRKTLCVPRELFEITVPVKQPPKPVTISFANHTSCSCLSKLDVYRQKHSIIRRALPECHVANKTCPKNQSWSNGLCSCVSLHDTLFPQQHSDPIEQDFCGLNKELDEETCRCVCRKDLRTAGCGPKRHLDKDTCQCVCKTQPKSCSPHQTFNKETCQCSCNKVCPSTHPLNRTKCACECNESHSKCFLRGRRFQPATCSCYRLPCPGDPRKRECEEGFYFSEERDCRLLYNLNGIKYTLFAKGKEEGRIFTPLHLHPTPSPSIRNMTLTSRPFLIAPVQVAMSTTSSVTQSCSKHEELLRAASIASPRLASLFPGFQHLSFSLLETFGCETVN
ncbi:Vascular endothelial growth factor C [Bagarius yarrelli]|uniref:Vascular endothelial growth factor C n=1 Tax=Bagarius yarrelli TaxID=175774 RepID=A0A556V767_BAGYA|nr:Vascular endothelial growth factor C [Bagarius yarrelli]